MSGTSKIIFPLAAGLSSAVNSSMLTADPRVASSNPNLAN